MSASLACILTLAAPVQDRALDATELRAALEALRDGLPGEREFEDALPHLPDLIRSRSGWFVAAGAHLAALHDRRECLPALLDVLRAPQALHTDDRQDVLDALIRLEARVDPADLALDPEHPAESLLLLALDARANLGELARLMRACAEDEPARWAAACLLADARDGRAAEFLIGTADWPVDVVVRDRGSDVGHGSGSTYSGLVCSHPPWPPMFRYELVLPGRGEALAPIRSERHEYEGNLRVPPPVSADNRNSLRARLLDHLLSGFDPVDGPRADEDLVLDYSDVAAFERALREHVGGLRARIGRAAQALEAAGLLERAEVVAARARIRVAVRDLREESLGSLPRPAIPGVYYD